MSYNITEFKINDSSAYLCGKDITLDENKNTEQPASCESIIKRYGSYENCPEFVHAMTDSENRFLCGIRNDGSVDWVKGIPKPITEKFNVQSSTFESSIQNAITKAETELTEKMDELGLHISQDIYEFTYVVLDSTDKILFGIYRDGSVYIPKGMSKEAQLKMSELTVYVQQLTQEFEDFPNNITIQDDLEERLEMTLDSDDKIISFRETDGILHENIGIVTPSLKTEEINTQTITSQEVNTQTITTEEITGLSDKGLTELELMLKQNGFSSGTGDWSDKTYLELPEPKCAVLNIRSDFNLSDMKKAGYSGAVKGVNYDIPTQIEFWDIQGNYFKKYVLMSAQGNSSMSYIKKNIALDFFNEDPSSEDFNDDNSFEIKFGNWRPYDSFHLKAYYEDFFKGVSVISYQLDHQIDQTRGIEKDKPYKQDFSDRYPAKWDYSIREDSLETNMDVNSFCHPMGFPVIVYQNGEFYGIYAWLIKKHRDNYW